MTAMPSTADLERVVQGLVAAMAGGGSDGLPIGEWMHALGLRARLRHFTHDDVLVEHHAVAEDLHFLVEGCVRYRHLVTGPTEGETVDAQHVPWMPIGWSSLHVRRYRVTAVGASDGRLLTLPLDAWDELARHDPALSAHLSEFVFRTATRMLWEARGRRRTPTVTHAPKADLSLAPEAEPEELRRMLQQSPAFSPLPEPCRHWLAECSVGYRATEGTRVCEEGAASDGLWFLLAGRVALRSTIGSDGDLHTSIRYAVRPGTLLCWSSIATPLPAPYGIDATRDTILAFVPQSAIAELVRRHPGWAGTVFQQQLWQLRSYLVATRTHHGDQRHDGSIDALGQLIEDSKPVLPVDSGLYGVPYLLENQLTRRDGFARLYSAHFTGTQGEQTTASLALDLLRDLERAHHWFTGLQATYAAVAAHHDLEDTELRKLSTRNFRDALSHIPYVIKGWENLPDDPNCIFIYNHMAYAPESIFPNGFLFNPDSHFISSIILEPKYGDGLRVSRANASTEFWRADYYERQGHISVMTPESGWREETPDEKERRKEEFFADCAAVLASGQPFAIAPEGNITEEESATERSPGPLKAGAFIMSARLPSRPRIVPVALANFDKPPHEAVFSCVIKPAFTMDSWDVDVDDRASLDRFLTRYRQEFRGQVEEAIELAHSVTEPGADLTGLVSNVDGVDTVHEEFEHDVRAVEHGARRARNGRATVFYGSSTIRQWETLADDVDLTDVVNLGFGGATLEACRIYFERLVLPYEPFRLIIYGGDNDISRGASSDFVVAQFRELVGMAQRRLPTTQCWFVSIKPSPARLERLATIEQANARIASEIKRHRQWHYVDWFRYMLDEDARPNPRLFRQDLIHVNVAGYGILANLLRREFK
jgi:CRP-like cAMP-binding protein/lysophospholipase L1-like esterase